MEHPGFDAHPVSWVQPGRLAGWWGERT